jgi:hypothetical protein
MSEADYVSICHGLENLVKSHEASMLSEQLYANPTARLVMNEPIATPDRSKCSVC